MIVRPDDVQDRDGALDLLASVRSLYPWLNHIFADRGYAGDKPRDALQSLGDLTIELVKRSDAANGFVLLPRRWATLPKVPRARARGMADEGVERTFAWLNRSRRLAKDVEATIESSVTWLYIARVKLISRRLARA
jgi:transposase